MGRNQEMRELMENKSGGRFVAEFGVIVLGVLTALVLESAWQSWQDSLAEEQYLVELRAEAQQNLQRITAYVEESDSLVLRLESALLRINTGETAGYDAAILATLVRTAWQSGILTGGISRAVFDDLTNTGNLRLIKNNEIRHSAASAYALYESSTQRVTIGNERVDSGLLRLLGGYFFPISADITQIGEYVDLEDVISDPLFQVEANREHHRMRYVTNYVRQLEPVFRDLISLLDAELGTAVTTGSA